MRQWRATIATPVEIAEIRRELETVLGEMEERFALTGAFRGG